MTTFEHLLFMMEINDFKIRVDKHPYLILTKDNELVEDENEYTIHITYSFTVRGQLITHNTSFRISAELPPDITPELVMKRDITQIFSKGFKTDKVFGNIDFDGYEFPKF